MKNLRNSVRLLGNLGANPEVKNTSTGKKMAKINLATNDAYRDEQGNLVKETVWHNLTLWGKQAETAEKYLKKGSELAIEGKLINKNYTDKDGNKKYVTEIMVLDFLMLGGKSE